MSNFRLYSTAREARPVILHAASVTGNLTVACEADYRARRLSLDREGPDVVLTTASAMCESLLPHTLKEC